MVTTLQSGTLTIIITNPLYFEWSQDSYCHVANTTLVAPITGFVNVTSGDQNALKIALLKHGPISIAIYASLKTFSFYHNGVYDDKECSTYFILFSISAPVIYTTIPSWYIYCRKSIVRPKSRRLIGRVR